jgi:hypothetical protein
MHASCALHLVFSPGGCAGDFSPQVHAPTGRTNIQFHSVLRRNDTALASPFWKASTKASAVLVMGRLLGSDSAARTVELPQPMAQVRAIGSSEIIERWFFISNGWALVGFRRCSGRLVEDNLRVLSVHFALSATCAGFLRRHLVHQRVIAA